MPSSCFKSKLLHREGPGGTSTCLGFGSMEMRVMMGGGYVPVKWLKQRALKKLLEAGISRVPCSARKAAGAARRLKGFPGRSAGPGLQRCRGRSRLWRGPEALPPVGRGRRGRTAPAVPYIRVTLGSSAACKGRVGGVCLPENAGLCHPGAGAGVRGLPLPRGWIFFGCAGAPPT